MFASFIVSKDHALSEAKSITLSTVFYLLSSRKMKSSEANSL